MCKRHKLKVNVNKSKVMVYESSESKVVGIDWPFKVRFGCPEECKIRFNGEKIGGT